jgi:putative ABC transport system permease protein
VTRSGIVYRHLKARPLRTLLTIGAFSLSVGLLGFLLVLNEAFKMDFSPFTAQRVVVMSKGSFMDRLPMAYEAKIQKIPGVLEVVPMDFLMAGRGDMKADNQVPLSAAPAERLLSVYREANLTDEQRKAWLDDPRGAMIGRLLAKKYGWKVGDRIVLKAPVPGGVVETTVRAVMRYDLDNGVYLHRRYYDGITGNDREAMMFWVMARSREDVQPITVALEKAFDNAPAPIRAMTEKQWQLFFLQMIGNVKALIGGIGLATAFALLLITSNTLATVAGLVPAVGLTRRSIVELLRQTA